MLVNEEFLRKFNVALREAVENPDVELQELFKVAKFYYDADLEKWGDNPIFSSYVHRQHAAVLQKIFVAALGLDRGVNE